MGQTTIESYITSRAAGTTDAELAGVEDGSVVLVDTDTFASQDELDALVISGGGISVASEAEAKAGSNNTKAMTPARAAVVAEKYSIERAGATQGGDNTSAINAAVATVEAAGGGTVFVPSGNWPWAGTITFLHGVSLWGTGSHWFADATDHSSRLVASNAAAKVIVDGGGGAFGNLVIDGAGIASGSLLHRTLGAERMFQTMLVCDSVGEGIRIDEAQNDTWLNVQSAKHATCLIIDEGAGGNAFRGCEFAHTSGWHVIVTDTTGAGPYGAGGPGQNLFDHCLMEYGPSGTSTDYTGGIDIRGGSGTLFRKCVVSSATYGTTTGLVRVNDSSSATLCEAEFEDCWFFGDGTDTGFDVGTASVWMNGRNTFQSLTNAWRITSAATVGVHGSIAYTTVTNRLHASSTGTWDQVKGTTTRPMWLTELESTDNYALVLAQRGDAASRFYIDRNGQMVWGGGSGALDTVLYRGFANLLTVAAGDSFQVADGTWNGGRLLLGNYHIWVDASGDLRIKNGAPGSDGDGTVIGTQS
jgi:hypothetical protein